MRKEIVKLRTEQQLEWNDDTSRCPRIWPVGQQLQGNFLAYMSFLWGGLAPRALSYIELMSMFLKVPCLQTNIGTSWWRSYSFSRLLENKWPKYLPHDVSISLRNILKIHLCLYSWLLSPPSLCHAAICEIRAKLSDTFSIVFHKFSSHGLIMNKKNLTSMYTNIYICI